MGHANFFYCDMTYRGLAEFFRYTGSNKFTSVMPIFCHSDEDEVGVFRPRHTVSMYETLVKRNRDSVTELHVGFLSESIRGHVKFHCLSTLDIELLNDKHADPITAIKAIFSLVTVKNLTLHLRSDRARRGMQHANDDQTVMLWEELIDWKHDIFQQYHALDLYSNHQYTDRVLYAFTLAKELHTLRLNLYGMTNHGLQTLCNYIHKQENLQSLFLDGGDRSITGKADPYATSISLQPISLLANLQKFGIYHKRPIVGMNDSLQPTANYQS